MYKYTLIKKLTFKKQQITLQKRNRNLNSPFREFDFGSLYNFSLKLV